MVGKGHVVTVLPVAAPACVIAGVHVARLLQAADDNALGPDETIQLGTWSLPVRRLLEQAAALVSDCPCLAGCPSCIGPLHLVEGAKSACLRLLSATSVTSESVLTV